MEDFDKVMLGIEHRRSTVLLDEIPGAYKSIDEVMANASELVKIEHTLRQIIVIERRLITLMKISAETTTAKVILAPSRIQGVGLFAIKNLAKGEEVPIWDQNDLRFFEVPSADDRLFFGIFHHYCIRTKGGYYGPKDFLKMSIGWYINHSDAPNLEERLEETTWRYYATRAIAKGEEVTMDYRTLDADYDNLPVRNTSHAHVDSDLEEVKQDTRNVTQQD